MARAILALQGLYYIATGAWSLVNIGSFQRVTDPKYDAWLVKTVGALVIAIGGVLTLSALRRKPPLETRALAIGAAAALTAVEAYYASRGRISPVYFGDAAAEVVFAGGLLAGSRD